MENYCDCVSGWTDKHLSRESRKLTVMMQRELVSYSVTQYKYLAIFSMSDEGLVFTWSVVYSTRVRITEQYQGLRLQSYCQTPMAK